MSISLGRNFDLILKYVSYITPEPLITHVLLPCLLLARILWLLSALHYELLCMLLICPLAPYEAPEQNPVQTPDGHRGCMCMSSDVRDAGTPSPVVDG